MAMAKAASTLKVARIMVDVRTDLLSAKTRFCIRFKVAVEFFPVDVVFVETCACEFHAPKPRASTVVIESVIIPSYPTSDCPADVVLGGEPWRCRRWSCLSHEDYPAWSAMRVSVEEKEKATMGRKERNGRATSAQQKRWNSNLTQQ
jgi:hypothetical protein